MKWSKKKFFAKSDQLRKVIKSCFSYWYLHIKKERKKKYPPYIVVTWPFYDVCFECVCLVVFVFTPSRLSTFTYLSVKKIKLQEAEKPCWSCVYFVFLRQGRRLLEIDNKFQHNDVKRSLSCVYLLAINCSCVVHKIYTLTTSETCFQKS